MIDQLRFLHADWLWAIIPLAFLLLAVFLFKEWKSGLHRRWLRSIVAVLSIICLALIALQPVVPDKNDTAYAIVLSNRYTQASLDSLKELYDPEILTYRPGDDLFEPGAAFRSVFMLGEGVAPFDLWQFDGTPAVYIPGHEPTGVVKLKYSGETTVGEPITIKGLYRNNKGRKRIILEALEGYALDSVAVGGSETPFSLSAETKASGRFLYHLKVKDTAGKVVSRDPLPVVVKDKIPLNVLIINAFPTFETKYLKNFLAESGHTVLVRSQVTRGKFRYESYNRPASRLNMLTYDQLVAFDLIIMDYTSLMQLSRKELNTMEEAIRRGGAGLFIQSDESLHGSSVIPLLPFHFATDSESEISLEGQKISKHPFIIKNDFLQEALHTGKSGMLTVARQSGFGKVGTTVLSDTYTLLLKGEDAAYKRLWTSITEAHARPLTDKNEWSGLHPVVFANQPHQFQLRSQEPQPKVVADNISVPMAQDIDIPGVWHGKIWPEEQGWHQISTQADSLGAFDYYVVDTTYWQGLVAAQTRLANRKYFTGTTPQVESKTTGWRTLNLIYFYLLFILGVGYLWLAPKL